MEALQKKRRSLSSQIKLLETSTRDPDTLSLEQVCDYHSQIVCLRKENVDLQDLISVKSSDEQYEHHEQQFFELAERVNTMKVLFDVLLSKHNDSSLMNGTMPPLVPGNQMFQRSSEVRLPKLDPPVFNGDLYTWLSFHDLFKSIIHNNLNLTGAQKLQYLKASLKGEPALLIQSIPITNANYDEAWGLLLSRYECKREIIRAHLERLINQPGLIGESPIALRKLIDTTSECVRSLDVLKVAKEDMFDLMVIHLVSKKLDPESRLQWERSLDDCKLPSLETFVKFLDRHARVTAVATMSIPLKKNLQAKTFPGMKMPVSLNLGQVSRECEVCKGDHLIYKCEEFLKLAVRERMDAAKKLRLCFNCLRRGHGSQQCTSGGCRRCQKPHHTLIHLELSEPVKVGKVVIASQAIDNGARHQVLLATALVKVHDAYGSNVTCRVFLDSGSQASFVTEGCAQILALPRRKMSVSVSGVATSGIRSVCGSVQLVLTSLYTQEVFEVQALVLPKITNLLPNYAADVSRWLHLKGLQLADPQFFEPAKVDILLGADVYPQLFRPGHRRGPYGLPSAMETALGWIVIGPIPSGEVQSTVCSLVSIHHVQVDSDILLQRFWEVESVPEVLSLTKEEKLCEEHFADTYSRDHTGRFEVKLPFRFESPKLGDSRGTALRRLQQVEKRLSADVDLCAQYTAFMEEYELLGHMSVVPPLHLMLSPELVYYLPHHAVVKQSSSTTKLRVVFDASSKSSSGVSLNDKLLVGPRLQEDLFDLLVRFRVHVVAVTADIQKMYRQVKMNCDDANYQRILWRKSPELPVCEFQLDTVTYGTASAPYQAVKSLQQLAVCNQECWPVAAAVVLRDFFVDDLMSGTASVEEALVLQRQLIDLLKDGGFELRKWASNRNEVIEAVPEEFRETRGLRGFQVDDSIKILGVLWRPSADCFLFSFYRDSDVRTHNVKLTKRCILSSLAKVYDPLGWLSPVTVVSKILFQEIWKITIDWDGPLPLTVCDKWQKYTEDLRHLEDLLIPRCIVLPGSCVHHLCGFCDASERAYAAAVYLVCRHTDGDIQSQLVAAKTKVAPVKFMSLPRLELCAAVLLVKLLSTIERIIGLKLQPTHCWSDSTIVLSWLAAPSYRWKTFVANRVSIIQDSNYVWHHVSSNENPADCASRGISVLELKTHAIWWTGPHWLLDEEVIHKPADANESVAVMEEERTATIGTFVAIETVWLEKFSSLTTLQRVTAYMLRFSCNARLPSGQRQQGFLTVQELETALLRLVGLVQEQYFSSEIQCLRNNRLLPSKCRLLSLNPFCDETGLLRVGGRLGRSRLAYAAKFPLVLPRNCALTRMIVTREHQQQLHASPQMLLAILRQKFWILCGRDVVRRLLSKCVVCHRQRASTASQQMAELPASRVIPCTGAFVSVGVDFAGPVILRALKIRGQKTFKGYIAIFVCFVVRAVHLELVSDLTTEAFLAALRRFVARRGKPNHIYSDCGTNFVGANKRLDELTKLTRQICRGEDVHRYMSTESIDWHFNPPGAPHFGGLWEAGVKSVKYHLKRVVGNAVLNFEEMTTILTQIEACLNSRPLTQLSSDPNDLLPLTPGHFLVGRMMSSVPEFDVTNVAINRLSRWQFLQRLVQDFWKRWQAEYLTRLQQRSKWCLPKRNLKIGELVLLKDERLAPMQWKLGRIVNLHMGQDQLVRVVTVKTADGEFQRPIVKISPLPLEDSEC